MSSLDKPAPPDQSERDLALDPKRSILVQAPAGSGKTDPAGRSLPLYAFSPRSTTRPSGSHHFHQRRRRRDAQPDSRETSAPDPEPLARRVLERSQVMGWKLLDLPAQLRISTIDSFCRDLASPAAAALRPWRRLSTSPISPMTSIAARPARALRDRTIPTPAERGHRRAAGVARQQLAGAGKPAG
jgi:hypothetical protein